MTEKSNALHAGAADATVRSRSLLTRVRVGPGSALLCLCALLHVSLAAYLGLMHQVCCEYDGTLGGRGGEIVATVIRLFATPIQCTEWTRGGVHVAGEGYYGGP